LAGISENNYFYSHEFKVSINPNTFGANHALMLLDVPATPMLHLQTANITLPQLTRFHPMIIFYWWRNLTCWMYFLMLLMLRCNSARNTKLKKSLWHLKFVATHRIISSYKSISFQKCIISVR